MELMNFLVYYKDESTCEDVGKTTGVHGTNGVQKVNPNSCYRSYAESIRATIKSFVDSPQECVGGTHITEAPGRYQRIIFP